MKTIEFSLYGLRSDNDLMDSFRMTKNFLAFGGADIKEYTINYDSENKKAIYTFGVNNTDSELKGLEGFYEDIYSFAESKGISVIKTA